jgi:Ca-activated chloride channel family protein
MRFSDPRSTALALLVMLPMLAVWDSIARAQQPSFKSSAELVTVAVVARDRHGRPVKDLLASDFEILDDGQRRSIRDFQIGGSTVSIALLIDTSGSMKLPPKFELSTGVATMLLASLSEGADEAGLFTFDKVLHFAHPFTTEFAGLRSAIQSAPAFGSTSLYDAIAETAQQLSTRPGRRALVVVTDGVDTSSRLTPQQVSAIASSIDMPVYVVAVGKPLEPRAGGHTPPAVDSANLSDLARWSGGAFYAVATPADGSVATKQIAMDVRHQYLLAFEPDSLPGWHRIDVRARQQPTLQARSGYWVREIMPAPITPAPLDETGP